MAWLLFAYSMGIFLFTFPIAYFFHRHPYRRLPLIVAVLVLQLALVLFMVASPYWVLVISRFLQGAASTAIWTVGFALICENVDEKHIGRSLGWAISGVSVGSTIAPPIGGALYWGLGWLAPFVFCIIVVGVDLIGRLLVIERKHLIKMGIDGQGRPLQTGNLPTPLEPVNTADNEKATRNIAVSTTPPSSDELTLATVDPPAKVEPTAERSASDSSVADAVAERPTAAMTAKKELTPWGVLAAILTNLRGLNAILSSFVFGIVMGALEPT